MSEAKASGWLQSAVITDGRDRGPARDVTEGDYDDRRVWYRALSLS